MEIKCTVEEFGQLVRGCEKGACYDCALVNLCGPDRRGKIETYVVEVTSPPAQEETTSQEEPQE